MAEHVRQAREMVGGTVRTERTEGKTWLHRRLEDFMGRAVGRTGAAEHDAFMSLSLSRFGFCVVI